MPELCLKLWRYEDAPEEFRLLSGHSGDEDWVLFCSAEASRRYWPFVLESVLCGGEDSYADGFGHVDRHQLPTGDIVVIFAHA